MGNKSYSPQEMTLANAWVERWLEFMDLISRVTGTDEIPPIIPPPTPLDEIEYMLHRRWFLENELAFIPLWRDFDNARIESDDMDEEDPIIDPELNKYVINMFLYFYGPENFYRLAVHLDLQTDDSVWEPKEEVMAVVRPFMVKIGELAVDFLCWIENHPEDGSER